MNNHSYQKVDPDILGELNPELSDVVKDLINTLKGRQLTYRQKEKALHIANETLFHDLVNHVSD